MSMNYVLPQAAPNITESSISSWIRNGNGFIASYGAVTATNTNLKVCAFSLFNPSNSGVNVIIYSMRINSGTSSVGSNNSVNVTTSNPSGTTGYTGSVTSVNQGAGTLSSAVSLSASANSTSASVTAVGTVVDLYGSSSSTSTELLSNGAIYFLPKGLAKGIAIFENVSTAGNVFGATLRWIEY